MTNIYSELLDQMERAKELREAYKEIGPQGEFATQMITHKLRIAKQALDDGDTVEIIQAIKSLQEVE